MPSRVFDRPSNADEEEEEESIEDEDPDEHDDGSPLLRFHHCCLDSLR